MDGTVNTDVLELKGKIVAIPSVDTSLTKNGYAADAKATGDALNARVKVADVVDNLTSNASDKPLSAKQGAELKRLLDELATQLGG